MGGLLQLPSTAWSSRRANPLRAAHGKIHRQSVDEVLRPYTRKLARPERFELPTPWFVARYSIQLSYGRALEGRASYHTIKPRPPTRRLCLVPCRTGKCRAQDGGAAMRAKALGRKSKGAGGESRGSRRHATTGP